MADISDKNVNLSQYKDSYGSFFMLHDTKAAIEARIIGFLLSSYVLPMIGATVIASIELINEKIKAV